MATKLPTIGLNPLSVPDGSANYTSPNGDVQILSSANGPVQPTTREAQKPEEAAIEVVVKPGTGIAGVGEKYVERVIRGVLARVILTRERGMPKRGVVVTLVVMKKMGGAGARGGSYLPILPSLLHAALLALLSAAIPLSMTYTSTLIAVSRAGAYAADLLHDEIKTATSLHVLCFSSKGHLLLNESEGEFDLETWEQVCDFAQGVCRGMDDGDVKMHEGQSLESFVRGTVGEKLREDLSWKSTGS